MKKTLIFLMIVALSSPLFAQTSGQPTLSTEPAKKEVKFGQVNHTMPRTDDDMERFRENRFGQFIHWGIYAIPGGVWKGVVYPGASEFLKTAAKISTKDWADIAKDFNPTKYNPKAWAKAAKAMGVKYATFTTKHHDGFCMWDTKYTDFNITNTTYKGDLVAEFVKAYNDEGIDVYLYYSILDWNHDGWRYKIESEDDKKAFETLKTFTRNQLVELLEKFPTVKGFWFDGTWDASWKDNGQFSYELEKELKALRPGLIVNSRMRADEFGARHFDSNGVMMGDYESGYERRLPSPYDKVVVTRDWEACMTIPENQWGYHAKWNGHIKKPVELIEMLVRCVALNGNFLLNFGPTAQGDFRTEEANMMSEIGDWMDKYAAVIHGCGYAGLERQDWGYYTAPTKKKGVVNMVVFNPPTSGQLRVKLDKGVKIASAQFVGEPKQGALKGEIKIEASVNGEFFVHIPKMYYAEPFAIQLTIENADGTTPNVYIAPLT